MNITLAVLLSVGAFALVAAFVYQRQKSLHETMRRIAMELGFRYTGAARPAAADTTAPGPAAEPGFRGILATLGPWRMEGRVRDVAVVCLPVTRGSGRSNTTYTLVQAFHAAPLGLGLQLGKETALSRLGKAILSLQDISVGSERFDAAVRIKGSDPARIKALLSDAGVQERILRALEYSSAVTVTDTAVCFEKQGTITDSAVYRQVTDLLAAVVEALADSRGRG